MLKQVDRWRRSCLLQSKALRRLLMLVAFVSVVLVVFKGWEFVPQTLRKQILAINTFKTAQSGAEASFGTAGKAAVGTEAPVDGLLQQCRNNLQDLHLRVREQTETHENSLRKISQMQAEIDAQHELCKEKVQRAGSKLVLPKDQKEIVTKLSTATKELQRISREELKKQFGEKRVVIDMDTDLGPLSIEMAPNTLMPYATKWFIDLVQRGYWDGCAFVRGASHVLQANCMHSPRQPSSIAFQEYTPKYPHKKHTVGIAGFPGGPDWYINIVDNVHNHGPGGQGVPEANPCFGTVIGGLETIEAIKRAPAEPSGFQALKTPVVINRATVRTL